MKFYLHTKSMDETKLWIQSVQNHDMSYGFSLWTVEKKGKTNYRAVWLVVAKG